MVASHWAGLSWHVVCVAVKGPVLARVRGEVEGSAKPVVEAVIVVIVRRILKRR